MESNMEDNSGLDLICARNSLSNGLLSETNPTTLSNLGRLKVEKVVTLVHQVTFKKLSANSANVCCFLSCCLPLGREKIRLKKFPYKKSTKYFPSERVTRLNTQAKNGEYPSDNPPIFKYRVLRKIFEG